MRILILGGTVFLGPHLVEAARARGHDVTLFNRGKSQPDLFPDVERIRGDREGGLDALRGRRWECVIDTSGYLPRTVHASAGALADSVEHYTFVSSISVYADNTKSGLVESDPVARLAPETPEELRGETYGALKARCEETVEELMPGRTLIVRAGLIYGPRDSTERSGYWPLRLARGGEVLAPGRPDRPIQLVDVRDLAAWIVRMAEARGVGVYNATGPDLPLTMELFLSTCRKVAGAQAELIWVEEQFLLDQKVSAYNELPLWVPEPYHAFETVDFRRAFANGLTFRPLAETVRDTLTWERGLAPGSRTPKVGIELPPAMTARREIELLQAWRERNVAAS